MQLFKKFFLPAALLVVVAAVAFFAGSRMHHAETPGLSAEYFAAEPQTDPNRPVIKTSSSVPAALAPVSAVPTAASAAAPAVPAAAPAASAKAALVSDIPAVTSPPTQHELGLETYFQSLTPENSQIHVVQAGDNLTKISKLYGVTTGQIMAANGLKDENKLQLGMKLKIMKDKWSLVVDKTTYTLYLKVGDRAVKTYRIGTGKDNSTPVGQFKIVNRLKDPTWYHDGVVAPYGSPDNPLGTRWLGFDVKSYGLHGTTHPESIGKSESLGCIRMLNSDVEELYELVPVGTAITILESPKIGTKQ